MPWMDYDLNNILRQVTQLEKWDMKFMPGNFCGGSAQNRGILMSPSERKPGNFVYRRGGEFCWNNINNSIKSGGDNIYLGMYDEYDEATAYMPMSDDHPDPPSDETYTGRWVNNDGNTPYWYLRLAGAAKEILNGMRPLTANLPSEDDLTVPPFIGDDATVYLGKTNTEIGLVHKQGGDGHTFGTVLGRQKCRTNGPNIQNDIYFYFDIEDEFSSFNNNGESVTIEVEFYDNYPGTRLSLQYDGLGGAYTRHENSFYLKGSKIGWKTVHWNISDGFFGNRQNKSCDFRICMDRGKKAAIRRVSVFLPE